MNTSLRALAVVFALSGAALAQPTGKSPIGYWTSIDDETNKPKSVIEIYGEGGKLFGRVVKLFRAPSEEQNPLCDKCEGALKNKPVIGMTVLRDLEKDGDTWSGGTIMDPANGKTYKAYIEVQENGAKLKVRGYVGFSLLGRTQYWLRTEKPAAPAPVAAPAAEQRPAEPSAADAGADPTP